MPSSVHVATNSFQVLGGARQHRVGAVVGGHRHPRKFVGDVLDVFGIGEHRHHSAALGAACRTAGRVRRPAAPRPRARTPRPRRPPRTGPRCGRAPRRARCPTTATAGPAPSRRRTAPVGQRTCAATCPRVVGVVGVPNSTSSSGRGTIPSTASAHRVTVSANTGSVSNNSRVIPGYWLPCPVNSHAVFGGSPHTPR